MKIFATIQRISLLKMGRIMYSAGRQTHEDNGDQHLYIYMNKSSGGFKAEAAKLTRARYNPMRMFGSSGL
jgi:hypothetical protein